MITYISIPHHPDLYEFAVEDNQKIHFVQLYEAGSNRPKPVDFDIVPEPVVRLLIERVQSSGTRPAKAKRNQPHPLP